jgi:DNA-directed RNA polymerase subunit RPC12/RpoP
MATKKTHKRIGESWSARSVCGASIRYPNKSTITDEAVDCPRCLTGEVRDTSNSRFKARSAAYECFICGKRTRATGEGEEGAGLCRRCFTLAGIENQLADGHITLEEYTARISSL